LRVLITADTVGGVWTYARELASELARRRHEVVLAALAREPSSGERRALERAGVELHQRPFRLEWMRGAERDLERTREWLLELAESRRPDVAHLNTLGAGALGWRVPTLVVGHSCVTSWWRAVHGSPAPPEWRPYAVRVRASLASAALVVAPTAWMLAALVREHGPLERTRVVANGRSAPPSAGASKQAFVLSVGRLWDVGKNVRTLDEAAEGLAWPVLVAGSTRAPDGSASTLRRAVPLGELGEAEVWRWMERARIYASPARYEPFGLSALEAALCGCALVLGDIPSLREVWGDAAIYVPPNDARALRAALARLIEDRAQRVDRAARARARARTFTVRRMASEYERCYRALARARSGTGVRT
jgi:glycosyltransferase involved in cell wall biosynthesis